MWSTVENEINVIKEQVNSPTNVNAVKEILSGVKDMLFPNGPGLLINIHRQTKSLYPTSFAGVNLTARKNIHDQVRYDFNINLDPTNSDYYTPFNSYIGREVRAYSSQKSAAGYSTVAFEQDLSDELKCSVLAHIQHVNNGTAECVLDYTGEKFTSTIALTNSDITKTEIIAQHLHEVHKKLAVGAELALQINNGKFNDDSRRIALVGRYYDSSLDGIISSTLSLQGMQLCLYKKINKQLKIGGILDVCFQSKNITGSVACELADKEFTLRTSVDSKGCVIANLLKNNFYRNDRINFKPTISLLCNLQKQVKLGIGFDIII